MDNTKDFITIKGARENNLKNIDLTIPKNKLVVMTGVSGSGKTSLAFDTLYQEGQRRYIESLSSYARQFLGSFEKPDVDYIDGLSPSISIDQKSTSNNPRSTVGTVTEIYDYIRLLYARIGVPHDPVTNKPLSRQTIDEMTDRIMSLNEKTRVIIMAPIAIREKGTFKKQIETFIKEGYNRAYVDGTIYLLDEIIELDKNKNHDFFLVIDRLTIKNDIRSRLYDALELACKLTRGLAKVLVGEAEMLSFSEHYSSGDTNFDLPELEPRLFSFNTPLGACPNCNGLGVKLNISEDLILNKEKTLSNGGIIPYRNNFDENINTQELEAICRIYKIDMNVPVKNLPREQLDIILYGAKEDIKFKVKSSSGRIYDRVGYEGIITNLNRRHFETNSQWIREWIESFMVESVCPVCSGARLNPLILSVKINKLNIHELTMLSVDNILNFFKSLSLNNEQQIISKLAIEEINNRLQFLKDVGLGYLSLARAAASLSGGEAQRIRLATQIGSKLTGVLYVLDEPSIGLHQKDNEKLIKTLKHMRNLGNTLVVVEHDEEMMLAADFLVDIGPKAGEAGGYVVASGTPDEVKNCDKSITGRYLSKKETISYPPKRRQGTGEDIIIVGAKENNLKDITVKIPIGKLTVVTGVSGSGKSTLVNEILLKGLRYKYYAAKEVPGRSDGIIDNDLIDKVVEISQDPIGRTPRSNPATYTGVFDNIRELYAMTSDARARGYEKGRFSFNVKGGRCEVCKGEGVKRISMHFLPDIYVPCEACHGTRYNRETLQIKYKGLSIADVLNMTVADSLPFFENHPRIYDQLKTINDVGLNYIKLGQSATTLSGGEAQRVKLASELYKRITPKSIFILDEPTTGLHADDVKRLISVLHKIVDQGATMVIIEHNLDIIKNADYLIDLGPDGGDNGGYVVALGTPEEVAAIEKSYTGQYLKKVLGEVK